MCTLILLFMHTCMTCVSSTLLLLSMTIKSKGWVILGGYNIVDFAEVFPAGILQYLMHIYVCMVAFL